MSFSKEFYKELLENIREKIPGLNVTNSDLERPTSDFMMAYFTHVLFEFGVDIKASVMNQKQNDTHWECYRDTIPYTRVYMALKQVCQFPKFLKNFGIMSLMDPKPEDIYFVAVIDHFHNFLLRRVTNFFHPLLSQLEMKTQNLEEAKSRKEELQQLINDDAAQSSRQENEQRQVDKQIAEGKVQLAEMQERQQVLQSQFERQETELIKLRQEYNQLKGEIERRSLWETLQKRLTIHQQQLAVLEEDMQEKSELRRQKAAMLREYNSAIANEEKACAAVEQIVNLSVEAESATSTLAQKKQQLTELKEKCKELKSQHDEAKKKIEAVRVTRASQENELAASLTALNDQKKKLEEMLKVKNEMEENCRTNKVKINNFTEAIASLKVNIREQEDEFKMHYQTLLEKVDNVFLTCTAYVKKS